MTVVTETDFLEVLTALRRARGQVLKVTNLPVFERDRSVLLDAYLAALNAAQALEAAANEVKERYDAEFGPVVAGQ